MKKLICADDVEKLIAKGESKVYVESNTIFTPFAKDIIKNNNLEVIQKKNSIEKTKDLNLENIDLNSLTEFLQIIAKDDLLQTIIQKLVNRDKKFEKESDSTGFMLVKGKSVNFEETSKNIYNQEIISDEEKIVGLLKVKDIKLSKQIKCEEILYVTNGNLKIGTTDRWYSATSGDIISLPKDQDISFEADEEVQLLYFSKESSWTKECLDIKEDNNIESNRYDRN